MEVVPIVVLQVEHCTTVEGIFTWTLAKLGATHGLENGGQGTTVLMLKKK